MNNPHLHLAPMAGITDLAFRTIINKYGIFGIKPTTATTEMISSRGLYFNDKKTLELLKTSSDDKKNLIVQIFGNEPNIMAFASEKLLKMGFEYIDINLGCPAKKIVKNGDGGALLSNPDLVKKIIQAVMQTGAKTSIKIRLNNIEEITKIAQDLGVYRIAIHGRTVEEGYQGKANWDIIRQIANKSSPLIIGNGDITSLEKAQETELSDIMVGRGALKIDKSHALEHLDLIHDYKGAHGIIEARKVMLWYFPNKKFRSELVKISEYTQMRDVIARRDLSSRGNPSNH